MWPRADGWGMIFSSPDKKAHTFTIGMCELNAVKSSARSHGSLKIL
jgi:hypothetical protein